MALINMQFDQATKGEATRNLEDILKGDTKEPEFKSFQEVKGSNMPLQINKGLFKRKSSVKGDASSPSISSSLENRLKALPSITESKLSSRKEEKGAQNEYMLVFE